ncbi:MAG: protein O-mannosyl-transferase family, partial [Polyangiales bacterium]
MSATAPQSSHAAASATKAGRPKGDHDGPAPSRRASASVTPKAYDMPHWRGLALAAALPMALLYLATASGYGGWLDSGTFIAAAVHLGIAHPPGHALAQLLHYPFTLLPCGPLAWRVAVASSVYAAIALGLTAVLLDRSLACFVGDVSPGARPATRAPAGRAQQAARHARWWRHALVLTAVWLLGLSPAWWLQAVRPEVYAAQIMLITLALERLTLTLTLRAQQSPRALAALLQAGFCWALGLSNHHFISITVLLPGLWLALQFARSHGARIWAWLAWATTTALWPLAYLPLRAGARGAFHLGRLNLGAPDDLSRFLWVVSAQAFQKNTGQGVPGELGERGESLLAVLHAHLHLGLLFTALAGAYLLLRQRHSRAFGILWLSLAIPVVLARAWLGFVRGNPDALGYLLPASLALALATLVLLVAPTVLWPRRRRLCLALATLAALAWLPAQAQRGWLQAARHRFTDTDTLSVFSLRALPARSVLVLHDPQSIFALFGQQAESGVRPDIEVVPVPLLPYPGLLGELLARSPELAAFLR